MRDRLFVRFYQPGDEVEIVQLLESVFEGWPKFDLQCSSLEHWRWKYIDNPYKYMSTFVSVSDDKIIGVNHELYQKLKFYDNEILVAQGVDNAVYPDFRRLGLSKKMYEDAQMDYWAKGAKFSYWNTGNKHLIKFALSNPDVYQPAPVPVASLVRIEDVDKHYRFSPTTSTWVERTGYKALSRFSGIRHNILHGVKDSAIDIKKLSLFDSRFDDFWGRVKNDYDYIVVRGSKYLNWRYCDPRGGSYTVFAAEKDKDVMGYIVLRVNRFNKEYPVGFVMDFLVLKGESTVRDILIKTALRFFDCANVNIVQCHSVKHSLYSKTLGKYGFLDSRRNTYNFFSARDDFEELFTLKGSSVSRLHFATGDLDFI